jgi:hypothetical protein
VKRRAFITLLGGARRARSSVRISIRLLAI